MNDWDAGMHSNMLRAVRRLGNLLPASLAEHVGPWLLVDAGVGMVRFNQALVAQPSSDPAADVAEAIDWFAARDTVCSFLLRDPHDAAFLPALMARGYRMAESEPAMLLESLAGPLSAPHGLDIREVRTASDVARYAEVDAPRWHSITRGIARTAADFPDFTLLLGELEGRAVATSMAVVTGSIVGIYNVQVQPGVRSRGFGRAMTAAAVEHGRAAGCNAACLQSTTMGLPLYRSMGFAARYSIDVYAPGGRLD